MRVEHAASADALRVSGAKARRHGMRRRRTDFLGATGPGQKMRTSFSGARNYRPVLLDSLKVRAKFGRVLPIFLQGKSPVSYPQFVDKKEVDVPQRQEVH